MKRKINVWDEAGHILEHIGKGVLLTTAADGVVDTMTIGWGTLGIEWSKPIFIAFVRESRYTKELLDKNPEFTVNIPYGEYDKSILSICGTRSGRDEQAMMTMLAGLVVVLMMLAQKIADLFDLVKELFHF